MDEFLKMEIKIETWVGDDMNSDNLQIHFLNKKVIFEPLKWSLGDFRLEML